MMRIELERIRGKRIDSEVDSLILTEGTLSYCVKGEEFNIDLENIDSLIVTDSPDSQLHAENEALREALGPLANLWLEAMDSKPDDTPIYGLNDAVITVGDIRAARAALAGGE